MSSPRPKAHNRIPTAAVMLCLGVLPLIGHLADSGQGSARGAFVVACALHLILFVQFGPGARKAPLWLGLISGGALLCAVGVPFMLQSLEGQAADSTPLALAVGWWAGALVAALTLGARRLASAAQNRLTEGLGDRRQIAAMGLVLFLCMAGGLVADRFHGGQPITWQAGLAGLGGAAYALAAAGLLLQGLRGMETARQPLSSTAVLVTFGAAMLLLAWAMTLPAVGQLRQQDLVLLLVLVVGLALIAIRPAPLVVLAFAFSLLALGWTTAAVMSDAAAGGGLFGPALATLLLVAVIALNASLASDGSFAPEQTDQPHAEYLDAVQGIAGSWLVRLDLDARRATFPLGGSSLFAGKPILDFSELLDGLALSDVLELMSRLQTGDFARTQPVDLNSASAGHAGFSVHILGGEAPVFWTVFVAHSREAEWKERAERNENLLSQAMLREEQLLSIASHELRTPIAILSMMTEELKAGLPWQDVEISFETTLARVVAILDDLRADSSGAGGVANTSVSTLREVGQQLLDVFGPAAVANGIDLRLTLSQQAEVALKGDQVRVFIALSKLVHNAIVHSKGTEVVLNAFLSREGTNGAYLVTWQISDDGVGIDPQRRDRILEPFSKGADNADDRTGLGLYTAKKAINLIGGELELHSEGRGTRFILTYPARLANSSEPTGKEMEKMTDVQVGYPELSVLLVEDNKLVGEITSARLAKLFGQVRWAETGTQGLEMFRAQRPDLLIVDQLLPGLSGSDLVREVRKSDAALPIVGITASTMGSECQELEAAGANLALEKPLSFMQLKGIVTEYFGAGKESAAAL